MYVAPAMNDRRPFLDSLTTSCLQGNKTLHLLNKIPSPEEVDMLTEYDGEGILIILDDFLVFPRQARAETEPLVLMDGHHKNWTIVFILQNPFHNHLVNLNRNVCGRFLMYQIGDLSVYREIGRKTFIENCQFPLTCLSAAKERYGLPYIFVNTYPFRAAGRRYSVYTRLFADERKGAAIDAPLFFPYDYGMSQTLASDETAA